MTFSSSKSESNPTKPLLIALTGAGISAESGIPTFRDEGGIWDEYDLMEVGTAQGWRSNPAKVLGFINDVKMRFADAKPNPAHQILAQLEKYYRVVVITQNIDTLHEDAGSSEVIHIHGRIDQVRSTSDPNLLYDWPAEKPLNIGDLCELGSQLRPHTVFFGENVLQMDESEDLVSQADVVLVIGTSMQVMPAAGLVLYAPEEAPKFLIDPEPGIDKELVPRLEIIAEKASLGMEILLPALERD
ncbi:MAG: NAD-dependent deacylase [Bacteroidia bacterium]|nr:NAD-dependent deacylase [Bacteroidia bacterium]